MRPIISSFVVFGKQLVGSEGTERTEPRSDVPDRGERRGERLRSGERHSRDSARIDLDEDGREREQEEIQQREHEDTADHVLVDDLSSEPDGTDDLRVRRGVQLAVQRLRDDEPPDHLYAAAGRSRRAADEHHEQEEELGLGVPLREVGGREPGRVHQRRDLKGPCLSAFSPTPSVAPPIAVAGAPP